jgi:hypothetical protein
MAFVFGVLAICIESWRRRHQFGDVAMWPAIFDDYLAGGFLITASRIAARDARRGRIWLAGAWGAATGMMYGSFFGHLVNRAAPDPSGVPVVVVLVVKAVLLVACLTGLIASLRRSRADLA